MKSHKNRQRCEVYSRICGYIRPTQDWAEHKQAEFSDRKEYNQCLASGREKSGE